ncbi:DUF6011 domain-containing protein [Gordonia paraffinivorans]|uniref:DUF6011 domain-containing protein n=1 Tax=Gordonia paraffinivorans TaxID=175628 RepID=UPI003C6D7905
MSAIQSTDPSAGYPDGFIDPGDKLLLAALRGGTYVLAVSCRVCGAPLTARRSKTLGIGPACRRKEAAA